MSAKIFTILALTTVLLVSCGNSSGDEVTRIVSPEGNAFDSDFVQNDDNHNEQNRNDKPNIVVSTAQKESSELETEIPVSEPEPPHETARISFVAAGDNVIHPCIYMDAERRATAETRKYNFKPMYEYVSEFISSYDIAFINQETLMGGEELGYSGYPMFNSPQDLGLDLVDLGFDIVNIANNHMCDKGEKGLKGTIDFWNEQKDVTLIGGYYDAEDYDNIRIIEREGVRIALLSYTYGTNGLTLPSSSSLIVPYINDEDIIRQCSLAKENSDLLIISVHWGIENQTTVSSEQERVAKLMAENGADVIIGHHPHVLQKISVIESDYGETLCIFSLGNLVSAMQYWQNMVGGFFTFDIVKQSDGTISVENPAFTPTAFYYGPKYFNSKLYFLKDYPADLAATHGTKNLYGSSATPDDMRKFAQKIMGDYLVNYEENVN